MTVALQIRDVPDEVRDALTKEARRQGQSVQAYLLHLVEREAKRLRNASAFERTRTLRVVLDPKEDPAAIIREGRDAGLDVDRLRMP